VCIDEYGKLNSAGDIMLLIPSPKHSNLLEEMVSPIAIYIL